MFKIPIAPMSVNKAWQGRKFKTPSYKQYEKDCMWFMRGKKIVLGDVEIHFKFYVKNHKMADLDNYLKPLIDIMVKAEVISDDRFVRKIIAEKIQSVEEYTEVFISKYN